MKSPEQLADALKQITDICTECEMPAIFVGTVKANDDVNLITYPGHDTRSDQGIENVAQQLYLAAARTPKSHLSSIILNVAAALCVANPEVSKLFLQDLGKKQAQLKFDQMRQEAQK